MCYHSENTTRWCVSTLLSVSEQQLKDEAEDNGCFVFQLTIQLNGACGLAKRVFGDAQISAVVFAAHRSNPKLHVHLVRILVRVYFVLVTCRRILAFNSF